MQFYEGMKTWALQKVNVVTLCAALMSLVWISFACWEWNKAPLLRTFLPPLEQLNISSPDPLKPTAPTFSHNQKKSGNGNFSFEKRVNVSYEKTESDITVPGIGISSSSYGKERMDRYTKKMPLEMKGCNYAKGKWIADSKRPLYSGLSCKQWLSGMWACRLSRRTDFSYEHFRWQPLGCEIPNFAGPEFLKRMRHKTIAFVGDSLARQQFQSLMCMVTGGIHNRKVEDVGKEYDLVKAPHAKRPDGWAYRFRNTNTTILFYWSACLCELQPLNISDPLTHYAMHIDRPAAFIRQHLHEFDVLVLNTGHHWSRWKFKENRWNMHFNGKPNISRKLAGIANAKNLTIHSVVQWLDSQLPQHPRLRAFFRTISPRHFVNGDWNTGGNCDNTVPLTGGSEVMHDGSTDLVAKAAVKGTRVELLDITALSQLRDEGHISKYFSKSSDGFHDCLHWCLPGIPDTWNEILSAQL